MNFDFSTDTIIPDVSGILTISGTGALEIPIGTTAQRPAGFEGYLRYNTDLSVIEGFTTSWGTIPTGAAAFVASFSAGTTGLTPNSATTGAVTLAGTLAVGSGGTGVTTTPTNGQILVGNGTNYTVATIGTGTGISTTVGAGTLTINNTGVTSNVAGTGISVSAATGAVTITNTGVTSLAGTANQITASSATGTVTLSVPSTFIAPGSIEVTTTLQVDGNTASSFIYSNASKQLVTTAAPTNGQLLIGSSGSVPVAATLTAGTAISIANAAGSITINNTGVASIAGTANQITASAATGAVTLSLPAAVTITTSLTISGLTPNSFLYAGTAGLLTTTAAPTNGQILIGSTGAAPVAAALTAGTAISIANAAGSITINNTGVTSFSLNDNSGNAIYTTTPTAATTGAVAATLTLKSQTQNTVFAGPTGLPGPPSFRTLVPADLPIVATGIGKVGNTQYIYSDLYTATFSGAA